MSRDLVKVFCPRNDRVGTVQADDAGLLVEYTAEVWHPTAIFGSNDPVTDRLPDDEAGALGAFCKRCNSPVSLSVRDLRSAALNGDRDIHQPFAAAADKIWVDAGRDPIYPPGQKRSRKDPRL